METIYTETVIKIFLKTHPNQDIVNICTSLLTHQITRSSSRSDIYNLKAVIRVNTMLKFLQLL